MEVSFSASVVRPDNFNTHFLRPSFFECSGTGLGLSITSKLVHRLGGTISLKSEYGKYAEFIVDLPFRGKPVNAIELGRRLSEALIVVVQPEQLRNYRQPGAVIGPDPTPFGSEIVKTLGLESLYFNTLGDACDHLKSSMAATDDRKCVVFVVHESLYEAGRFEHLQKVCHFDIKLMTFGPNYSVESTKSTHFKSLTGIFPSSLMSKIADRVENKIHAAAISTEISAHPGNKNSLFARLPAGNQIPPGNSLRGSGRAPDLTAWTLSGIGEKPQGSLIESPGCTSKSGSVPVIGTSSKTASGTPVPPTTLLSTPKASSTFASSQRNVKILYAEDNLVNQKVLSRVLARSGITDITIVDNGKEAVDICDTTKFDIIFMDVQMPVRAHNSIPPSCETSSLLTLFSILYAVACRSWEAWKLLRLSLIGTRQQR